MSSLSAAKFSCKTSDWPTSSNKQRNAVIDIKPEGNKSALHFVYRNQSFLLSDIFGVLAAYG